MKRNTTTCSRAVATAPEQHVGAPKTQAALHSTPISRKQKCELLYLIPCYYPQIILSICSMCWVDTSPILVLFPQHIQDSLLLYTAYHNTHHTHSMPHTATFIALHHHCIVARNQCQQHIHTSHTDYFLYFIPIKQSQQLRISPISPSSFPQQLA